jgi:uncharacterized membrane protein YeaQ/YmgE (transglycosylase-associated protein family)/uncharacterized protein YjbJ (UPF0337 family)
MNYITWLFAGAALGWLATIVIRRRRPILLLNIIWGMVSAFLAGYLLPRMFQIRDADPGTFSLPILMVSMGGAVILLGIVNFFRREKDVKDDVIGRKWDRVRNKINARWGKLTEIDIDQINGNHSRFITTLQARYGYAEEEAEDQIQRYLKAVL